MKRISIWRLGLILAVTALCLIFFLPTVQYLMMLRNPDANPEKLEAARLKAIPLGLDLRGGVDVTLRIDQEKALGGEVKAWVDTLKRTFNDKKVSAAVGVTEDGKRITVKALNPAEARNVSNVLKDFDHTLAGDISEERLASNQDVVLEVRSETIAHKQQNTIQSVEKILRERLDSLGLTQPSISIQGSDRVRVQVPGEKDPDKLIANLTQLAQMEFRQTHELYGTPSDPTQNLLDEKGVLKADANVPMGYELVPYKFGKYDAATQKVNYTEGKMLIEQAPVDESKKLGGKNLRATGVTQDPSDIENPIKVSMQFDDHGSDLFAQMTRASVKKLQQDGHSRNLAVVLDGVVRSAPSMSVVITGGSAVIEGGFSFAEADDLSKLLKAGSLPAPIVPESKQTVGASLGTDSIFAGVRALVWGTLAIVIFMVVYYGMAGVISIIALILNILMVMALLALSKATLTLSGIGGILLTIGMAVDTNVLIYERMREEFEAGRPMKQALTLGFDRAFAVIIDSHVTTLFSALVLLQFTSGSVFGFALTMCFGLIANLYTGLSVTYTLCALWFQWRGHLGLGKLHIFKNAAFDFIKVRYASTGLSIALAVIAVILVFSTGGLRMGVDFAGGLLAEVSFTKPVVENDIRTMLREGGFEGERVQQVTGTSNYIIRVKEHAAADKMDATATETRLRESLTKKFGADGYSLTRASSFGPETGQQFQTMAISVAALASLAVLLYLWFRFELVFGVAAIIALLHDLILTFFWSQMWGVEITLDVVAGLLVLIGFSVNDTIVIFDRIREDVRKHPTMSFREICNLAMNQSLARTIITSGTVFLVVFVMLLVGGPGLAPFSKVMLIGVFFGTYSSCFIAAPLVYIWNERNRNLVQRQLSAQKGSIGPEPARDPNKPRTDRVGGSPNLPRRRAV